jgi:hypothetical protein
VLTRTSSTGVEGLLELFDRASSLLRLEVPKLDRLLDSSEKVKTEKDGMNGFVSDCSSSVALQLVRTAQTR